MVCFRRLTQTPHGASKTMATQNHAHNIDAEQAENHHKLFNTLENDWTSLSRFLPQDLASDAKAHGAAANRAHACIGPQTLLRLVLLWVVSGFGLRTVAAWSAARKWAVLSFVALRKRFKRMGNWLDSMLSELSEFSEHQLKLAHKFQVVLIDATSVTGPSQAYKLSTAMDLSSLTMTQVYFDAHQKYSGETLRHFHFAPGQVVIADRMYCTAVSFQHALDQGADVLVRRKRRIHFYVSPESTTPIDVLSWLQTKARCGAVERNVWMKAKGHAPIALRMIATRQSERGVKGELKQMRLGRTNPTPEALATAKFLVLLTTADAAKISTTQALTLYRMRWQIELKYKRAKSLCDLDELRCKTPEMVRVWLLAHLLAQALADRLLAESISPEMMHRQASRSAQFVWSLLQQVLMGPVNQSINTLIGCWTNALPKDSSLTKTRAYERLKQAYEPENGELFPQKRAA